MKAYATPGGSNTLMAQAIFEKSRLGHKRNTFERRAAHEGAARPIMLRAIDRGEQG
jgi:hypothetical protein